MNDAAFKGNPESQYVLGLLFEKGLKDKENQWVVEPNAERAMDMYGLAAFNLLPEGGYRLAEMMVRDKTGSLSVQEKQKRHALMKRLYQQAASKGIKAAVLTNLLFLMRWISQKEKQARALEVAKAEAKSGNDKAALLYGMLLDRGIGTEADSTEAIYCIKKQRQTP